MKFIVFSLFVISLFSGSLIGYGLLPDPVAWLTELFLVVLFLMAVASGKLGKTKLPSIAFVLLCALFGGVSAIINGRFGVDVLFSLRLLFRFFILYYALIILFPNEKDLKLLNAGLIVFLLLQIPAAFIKFLFYGQGEAAIGLYSNNEGSLSTILPLLAIGMLLGYFVVWKRSMMIILMIVGFVAFSLIGGKRGLVFLLPLLIAYLIFLGYFTKIGGKELRSAIRRYALPIGLVFFVGIVYAGLRLIPTLNPEREVGGSVSVSHAIDYARQYTTSSNTEYTAYTGGRFSTTMRIYDRAFSAGWERVLLGYGAGAYTETRFRDQRFSHGVAAELKIMYGLTPLGYMQIEYGLVGVLLMFTILFRFYTKSWSYLRLNADGYWGGFFLGLHLCSFSMLVLFFAYHQTSLLGDVVPLIFLYISAVGNVMYRRLSYAKFVENSSRARGQ